MQLFVTVLQDVQLLNELLEKMNKAGFTGATVLESRGMAGILVNEDTPMFGFLRSMRDEIRTESRTVFVVTEDSRVKELRGIVNEVTGGMEKPNNGIMFAVPVSFAEGLAEEK